MEVEPVVVARCRGPLASRPRTVFALLGGLFLSGYVGVPALNAAVLEGASAAWFIGGLAAIVLAVVVFLAGVAGTAKAGDDGIVLEWLGRRRYVRYAEVARATADYERISFVLQSGRELHLQLVSHRILFPVAVDARHEPIAARIRRGVARASKKRDAGREEREERELSRGDMQTGSWLEAIERRAGEGGYRSAAIDRNALVRVAVDCDADPSARAASALVLRRMGMSEDESNALVEAAEGIAHPRVRVALETAANAEVPLETVRAAVRAAAGVR